MESYWLDILSRLKAGDSYRVQEQNKREESKALRAGNVLGC